MFLPWRSQKSRGSAVMPEYRISDVLDGLVAVVILRVHTQNRRLDAQVDVLGDERDARIRVLVMSASVCARIALSAL